MMKRIDFRVFLWLSLCLFLLIAFWPKTGEARIYKYTDKNGVVQITDRYDSIPPEYRNQIQTIEETPMPPPSKGEESKQPAPQMGGESERNKEAALKAAREKEAQEKKRKVREEKEARIAEITKQIQEKQEEKSKQRNNPMFPYQRNQFNILSQEIDQLEKEIQEIQAEMASDQ